MHKSCKSCTKNEAFLARYKKSLKNLARQFSCKIVIKSCKKIILQFFLEDFCMSFYILHKNFIFSARLARYVQYLVQDLANLARKILARKILARFAYFLQDGFPGLFHWLRPILSYCMHYCINIKMQYEYLYAINHHHKSKYTKIYFFSDSWLVPDDQSFYEILLMGSHFF